MFPMQNVYGVHSYSQLRVGYQIHYREMKETGSQWRLFAPNHLAENLSKQKCYFSFHKLINLGNLFTLCYV